ncbi:hypothetical protein DCAR_0726870 [Daucus carota subsp. sativus]|uniref:Uncharacterized protein n=1 Tax=Daucus carota subsp. sativus TaxID=79200 RepID=A0AAF0XG53_DAUCS|nr:hypothetical protein DCAR_0726870 [Daucus carota subsp. sativus]
MGETNKRGDVYQPMKKPKEGGFRATLFIYGLMVLDSVGFIANIAGLVLYFMNVMHFSISGSANTLTNYLGTVFLLTLVGGLISDSYMSRLNTCLMFGGIELLGYLLLIMQAHYPKLQPEACGKYSCVNGTKALLFYASICFAGLGGGGMRGSAPALGADQFDPKESKHIASFFNWFVFSVTVGAALGVTFVVWVSTNKGWDKGFIICMVCSFIGFCLLALGKPYYRARVPGESVLLRIFFLGLNWFCLLSSTCFNMIICYRVLDKAAILPEGTTPKKWKVCTLTQVEEVKILTRMMPVLLSTTLMNTCLAQLQTFSIQQGALMNAKLGSFNVPPSSIPIIPILFMSILLPLYEILLVPILRKLTGHPNGITHLQRVGVGLILSAISMTLAGFIELKRKNAFVDHNTRISLFWLSFHFAVFGIADMFTLVGLMEFFYSEAPPRMRSLSTSLSFFSLSLGYYLSSVFVEIINSVTGKLSSNNMGWLEDVDMNKNHLERFYWFLAIVSVLNFGNYIFWANWYKYKKDVPVDIRKLIDQSFCDASSSLTPRS